MLFKAVQCKWLQLNTPQYHSTHFESHWMRLCSGQRALYDESQKLNTAQCSSMQFNTIQCRRMQLNTAQYSSIQLNIAQCSSMKFNSPDGSASLGEAARRAKRAPSMLRNLLGSAGMCWDLLASFLISTNHWICLCLDSVGSTMSLQNFLKLNIQLNAA